jgi:hypothetical protein
VCRVWGHSPAASCRFGGLNGLMSCPPRAWIRGSGSSANDSVLTRCKDAPHSLASVSSACDERVISVFTTDDEALIWNVMCLACSAHPVGEGLGFADHLVSPLISHLVLAQLLRRRAIKGVRDE